MVVREIFVWVVPADNVPDGDAVDLIGGRTSVGGGDAAVLNVWVMDVVRFPAASFDLIL